MVTFVLGIPSCGQGVRGANTLDLLQKATLCREVLASKAFTDPKPNYEWADEMWQWGESQGVETGASHFITIQDDVKIHKDFWGVVSLLVYTRPGEVICLQTAHPASLPLSDEGKSWMTTTDGLVGVAYIVPMSVLQEFNVWRAGTKNKTFIESQNEDTLLAFWCVLTGRKIHHPIPTPIEHDLSLQSTYGNDSHGMRKTLVSDLVSPVSHFMQTWKTRTQTTAHIGRIFDFSPIFDSYMAGASGKSAREITGKLEAYMADTGANELKRLRHSALAIRDSGTPDSSIMIATPTRGGVHPEYAATVWRLLKTEMCDFELASEVYDVQSWQSDVVRTRSALVAYFLQKTTCTHLLFLDSDVAVQPECVKGMLMSGYDFVAAPYPRRDAVDFLRVQVANKDLPADAAAYRYSIHMSDDGLKPLANGCAEIEGIGLGCALLSRKMLQEMTNRHKELTFTARGPDGRPIEACALFQLELTDGKLYSEDYSFCRLYRSHGGKIMMYLGAGSPVDHYGEHRYRGAVEAFGMKRVQK